MKPREVSREWLRLLTYGWKFTADRAYRNKVISLARRVEMGSTLAPQGPDPFAEAKGWISGKRIYFIGGCEFTYVRELFESAGCVAYDTFAHHRHSDPLVEVGDSASPLWEFRADAVVVSQSDLAHRLLHQLQWSGRSMTRAEQDADLDAVIAALEATLARIRDRLSCPIFVLGLPVVHRPSLGVYDQSLLGEVRSLAEMVLAYRARLYEVARQHTSVHILDPQVLLEDVGATRGTAADELLGGHFTQVGGRAIALGLLRYLHAADSRSPKVKVIVVDLDNTLWSGVLREDGPDGVFVQVTLVRAIKYLMARGILVAVCSKNDVEEVAHLPGLLGQDFVDQLVAVRLSWQPKSVVVSELADALNLGLDSFAFFDDNERERAEVAAAYPEVRVFADTDILASLALPEFQAAPYLSSEAEARSASYRQEVQRAEVRDRVADITPEEFLRSLEMKVSITPATLADLPRVAELLGRTNQLNATGRRTDLAVIRRLFEDLASRVIVVRAADRFGDFGLIGVAICTDAGHDRALHELAFSCRAMGRGVEAALLSRLSEWARKDGIDYLVIEVTSTSRNAEMLRILSDFGFEQSNEEAWRLPLGDKTLAHALPDWLEVT